MDILFLGGSRFVGRAIVEEAVLRGHTVTTFNRGRSTVDVPGVESARGDREIPADVARLAEGRWWDVVIDTSGFVPGVVGNNARALSAHAQRYVFISTVSVYADWPEQTVSEDSPTRNCSPGAQDSAANQANWPPGRYGDYKAGCERAIQETFREQALVLRPGVVLGPREDVGRLPWWLRRTARGGRMVAPGDPNRSMQPIDARDLAAFTVSSAEHDRTGTFNVAAAQGSATYGSFIDACVNATGSDAEPVWVDDEFLVEQGVRQWTELPLWRTPPGTWSMSTERATTAGLSCRALHRTVRDTWNWMNTGDAPAPSPRAAEQGIDTEKERQLLTNWMARRP